MQRFEHKDGGTSRPHKTTNLSFDVRIWATHATEPVFIFAHLHIMLEL